MATQIIVKKDKGKLILSPVGRFDFHVHGKFSEAYREKLNIDETDRVEVDFSEVEYIDSSALSMLISLREMAFRQNKEVTLINCKGMVQRIMDAANFSQLFKIVSSTA